MSPGRVVAATWLCERGDGAVLAVRPYGADAYYLPGGMPEPGETLAEAAAREVAEEVGNRLDPAELVEVARVEAAAHGRPGVTVLLVCFTGRGDGEPQADGKEIVEVAWLTAREWHLFASAVQLCLAQLGQRSTGEVRDSTGEA